jgi:outer membrane protein TolC
VTLALVACGVAVAQTAPSGDIQGVPGVQMPSPMPQPTVSGTPIPYPAYGSPAPDVARLRPRKGVPQSITLQDAIRVAVALSPAFATQNALWAAIHARYTSDLQLYYPTISGDAHMGKQYSNGTSASSSGSTPIGSPTPLAGALVPAVATAKPQVGGYSASTIASESATITLTQLIYDGGRTIAEIRSAKAADIAGRATLLRSLQTLAYNVATAYYAVLEDNATVKADAQLVHEFQVNEASVAAQIRNGAAPRSDIAAAQFQTAQAKGNLVTAQGTAIGAQATFATTLGLDADAMAVPKTITGQPTMQNLGYDVSLKRAMLMRPDYISAAYTVASEDDAVRYAKLARFPVLSASASDGTSRTFIDCYVSAAVNECPGPQGWSNDKSLGLDLTVPIYDSGQTNYNVAYAAAQRDQAIASLNTTRLTVESDVRSALATLVSSQANLVQARSELTSAQVSLDATQAQYRVGAATILNVVTAEANLSTAQSAYISAFYGVYNAQQNYLYATGVSDVQL